MKRRVRPQKTARLVTTRNTEHEPRNIKPSPADSLPQCRLHGAKNYTKKRGPIPGQTTLTGADALPSATGVSATIPRGARRMTAEATPTCRTDRATAAAAGRRAPRRPPDAAATNAAMAVGTTAGRPRVEEAGSPQRSMEAKRWDRKEGEGCAVTARCGRGRIARAYGMDLRRRPQAHQARLDGDAGAAEARAHGDPQCSATWEAGFWEIGYRSHAQLECILNLIVFFALTMVYLT